VAWDAVPFAPSKPSETSLFSGGQRRSMQSLWLILIITWLHYQSVKSPTKAKSVCCASCDAAEFTSVRNRTSKSTERTSGDICNSSQLSLNHPASVSNSASKRSVFKSDDSVSKAETSGNEKFKPYVEECNRQIIDCHKSKVIYTNCTRATEVQHVVSGCRYSSAASSSRQLPTFIGKCSLVIVKPCQLCLRIIICRTCTEQYVIHYSSNSINHSCHDKACKMETNAATIKSEKPLKLGRLKKTVACGMKENSVASVDGGLLMNSFGKCQNTWNSSLLTDSTNSGNRIVLKLSLSKSTPEENHRSDHESTFCPNFELASTAEGGAFDELSNRKPRVTALAGSLPSNAVASDDKNYIAEPTSERDNFYLSDDNNTCSSGTISSTELFSELQPLLSPSVCCIPSKGRSPRQPNPCRSSFTHSRSLRRSPRSAAAKIQIKRLIYS
jgi:hypothetical protein